MSELEDFRWLVEQARQVGRMPIDAGESREALAAVRRRLGAAAKPQRSRMVLIMSGSVAAAALIAIGLMLMPPRKVDAAEALQNAADATGAYRGWVHVTPVGHGEIAPALTHRFDSIHINTADGTFAVVANFSGTRLVEWTSPAAHERRTYTDFSGKVLISPMQDEVAVAASKRAAEYPLRLADYLRQIKARGLEMPNVVESVDQGMERFDLSLSDNAMSRKFQYTEMPEGKLTLWADPRTKLISKMSETFGGQASVMEYTYGAPEIRDIYDLGVPKTAQVVDGRGAGGEKHPAVFDLPATDRLVKDESIDVNALQARLQKRINGDWGDFVSVECDQVRDLVPVGHEQGHLTIAGREEGKSLYAIYLLAPELALFGGQGFPKGWPMSKLADVDSQLRPARPIRIDVFDGRNGWHGEPAGPRIDSVQVTPTLQMSAPVEVKGSMNFWPDTERKINGFGTTNVEVLRDPGRPGLIVMHVDQTLPMRSAGSTSDYHSDTLYWLDPAGDDLPVETLIHRNSSSDKLDTTMHFVYLDFGRLADGRLYPSRWQYRGILPSKAEADRVGDAYTEYWRQVFQREKLGPDWYGDPNLRITDSWRHFPATEPAGN